MSSDNTPANMARIAELEAENALLRQEAARYRGLLAATGDQAALDVTQDHAARAGDLSLPSSGAPRRSPPIGRDRLLVALLTSIAILAVGFGLLMTFWDPAPISAEVPLFIPTVSGISSLAAASVAYLAIGRYRVLGRPSAFWAALGFGALAILMAFYVLAWPGMGPDGSGIIASDPNTSAWLFNLAGATTLGPLIAAALVRWPGPGHRAATRWVLAAWHLFITSAGVLSVVFEASLPRLVVAGSYPASSERAALVVLVVCIAGTVLSTWRYRASDDSLLGYVAIFEMAQAFSVVAFFSAEGTYDVWWYVGRLMLAGGVSTALFGLLGEYVALYRREREQSAALRATDAQLRGLNDTLEERVVERTQQLRGLAVELTSAEERERQRLADLLHDDLQQTLAAVAFHLDLAREQMPATQAHAWLAEPMAMLREAIQTTRSLSAELRPNVLSNARLDMVLQGLAERMAEQHGLRVTVEADEPPDAPPVPESLKLLLYRSVGELLFNVAKHAGVHEATVRIERPEPNTIRIVVADEGRGFDLAQHSGDGHGLFSVTERLAHIGGDVRIESAPGRGTRVCLQVPVDLTSEAERGAPARQAAGPTSAPTPAQSTGRGAKGRIRVLVAADHTVVRDGLHRLLDDQPDVVVVGEARDGRQIVDLARSLHPDVVVIGPVAPAADAADAAYRVSAELPGTRIVGLGAPGDESDRLHARWAGAEGELSRESTTAALLAAIRGQADA